MKPNYIVIYYEGSIPQYFVCTADNAQHAIEQCRDAYPKAEIRDFSKLHWSIPSDIELQEAYDRFFGQ